MVVFIMPVCFVSFVCAHGCRTVYTTSILVESGDYLYISFVSAVGTGICAGRVSECTRRDGIHAICVIFGLVDYMFLGHIERDIQGGGWSGGADGIEEGRASRDVGQPANTHSGKFKRIGNF